jgi:hypothetical protein
VCWLGVGVRVTESRCMTNAPKGLGSSCSSRKLCSMQFSKKLAVTTCRIFRMKTTKLVQPSCPACPKTLDRQLVYQPFEQGRFAAFVEPALIKRLTSRPMEEVMLTKDYIDPQGYWIDSSRNIRRMSSHDKEQPVILRATQDCSDAEWSRLYEAIVACLSIGPEKTKVG